MQQNAVRRMKCSSIATMNLDLSLISTRVISKKGVKGLQTPCIIDAEWDFSAKKPPPLPTDSHQTILELLIYNQKLRPEWDLISSQEGNEYYAYLSVWKFRELFYCYFFDDVNIPRKNSWDIPLVVTVKNCPKKIRNVPSITTSNNYATTQNWHMYHWTTFYFFSAIHIRKDDIINNKNNNIK